MFEQLKNLPLKQLITFSVSIIFSLLLGTWFFFFYGIQSTDNAYIKTNMAILSPKITGYIAEVLVEDNQEVTPGKVIARIDTRDFKMRLQQAESQLEAARSRLDTLDKKQSFQEARIRLNEASIAAAQAELDRATKDLERFTFLHKEGTITPQVFDEKVAAHKSAQAMLNKGHAEYDAARKEAEMTHAQYLETRAEMCAFEAAVELARIDLENTEIKASIKGIIGNRKMQVGQLVRPGMALAYLIPTEDIWVEANFKETQIAEIKPGQKVTISVDSLGGRSFTGHVHSLSPASGAEFSLLPPENATGNFTKIVRRIPVKILFVPSPDLVLLKPGMSTIVKVRTA